MAMEINGNFLDYSAKTQNYSSNAEQSNAAGSSESKSRAEYASELAKLVPSVDFKVGSSYASAKSGKTLTVNPQLLEKMRNDPEKEKEMKELIKGVESMTRLSESFNKASGWKTVFRHSYIDENGKYCHIALIRNEHGYKMSEKLREERRKNAEKLIEKQKEKVAKKKEEIQKTFAEKRTEKRNKRTEEAEKLFKEKYAASNDGMIYLNDTEFKTVMEAIKEDDADKTDTKEQVGANVDIQV